MFNITDFIQDQAVFLKNIVTVTGAIATEPAAVLKLAILGWQDIETLYTQTTFDTFNKLRNLLT